MKTRVLVVFLSLGLLWGTGVLGAQLVETVPGPDAKLILGPQGSPTSQEEARVLYNEGSRLLHEGDYDGAVEQLLLAVQMDPGFTDAMDHLGIAYRRMGNLEAAEEWYGRSLEVLPSNTVAYLNLSLIYRAQGRLGDAHANYQKVIELEPDNPEGYYGMGEIFQQVEEYETSAYFLQTAIQKYLDADSEHVYDAVFLQGFNFYKLQRWEDAVRFLELAQAVHGDNPTLLQALEESRERLGAGEPSEVE
ncbi:tetratricopeptide repeat protein [Spirochaeta lutea]|uniref:Uncharacterized protein n=1 Tax=Spirochaeta lutea TaxID=1480694 RepID=A0A098QU03_9SPIO|nr:tetratricopeptide repeat protein [Spirochaeta lutea]KGE70843.1 hypothetical protein DC28_15325 [Spirochaeta lutea]